MVLPPSLALALTFSPSLTSVYSFFSRIYQETLRAETVDNLLSLTSLSSLKMMFSTSTLFSVLSAATVVLSVPVSFNPPMLSGCPLANAKLSLPAGQTAIAIPTGTPVYVALGVGTQVRIIHSRSVNHALTRIYRTTRVARLERLRLLERWLSYSISRVWSTCRSSRRFRIRSSTPERPPRARLSFPRLVSPAT